MSKRTKEIKVVVEVPQDVVNTAYKILSNALNHFDHKYARIEIATPSLREYPKMGDQK